MEFQLDQEWRVRPIKGDTGKTYIGMRNNDRVFIKRNTTPMLAALSREGITPRLVWTKRTGNGDTLTAQEWMEGRILTPDEIGRRNDVIDVLYHLHHSSTLKTMMEKIGGKFVTPELMLQEYQQQMPDAIKKNKFLELVLRYLKRQMPSYNKEQYTVVHGDVNHRNWMVCQNYLYLVDWDSIMFADPAVDIGTILGHYVPLSSWSQWLVSYGIRSSDETLERMHWYAVMNLLQEVSRLYKRNDFKRMNAEILQLKRIFSG
ncbi:aminoglycoside phosphotransferase [Enterococcus sp. JM4C]|uniref:phosphotransferase family protein n=1 Tax=Candidatus Enterococcus huntleyi TaxID=1857217 RepID=UPI00137A2A02|nr:phosphotransferase family protein [Enterococcus sp. JM4C]KAF1299084.1 aminoglycoside phosphotransferase [Enterococcus sp. JM4C]